MSVSFSISEAGIVGLFMAAVFYGIYLVSLGYCLQESFCKAGSLKLKNAQHVRWWLLGIVLFMAVILSLDLALLFRYNLRAFIWRARDEHADAAFRSQNWITIVRSLDYIAINAIGDAILIVQLFRLYEHRLVVVIVPVFLYLAGNACALAIIVSHIVKHHLDDIELPALQYSWVTFVFLLNVIVTLMIIVQLWRIRARTPEISGPHKLLGIIGGIIIDSGLLYTLCTVAVIATITEDNIIACTSDGAIQAIGVTLNLIIIRLHAATAVPRFHYEEDLSALAPSSTGGDHDEMKVYSDKSTPLPIA